MFPEIQQVYIYTDTRLDGMTKMNALVCKWTNRIPGLELLGRYGCNVLLGQQGI